MICAIFDGLRPDIVSSINHAINRWLMATTMLKFLNYIAKEILGQHNSPSNNIEVVINGAKRPVLMACLICFPVWPKFYTLVDFMYFGSVIMTVITVLYTVRFKLLITTRLKQHNFAQLIVLQKCMFTTV